MAAFWLALVLGVSAPPALAQQPLPLWELGAAFGAGWLPQYPASNQHRVEALALPYFAYRGKVLRSDDKGLIRGRLAVSENAEFDISLAGALSTNSTDNRARAGMPDLDWMGEVGPRLQLTLARAERDAKIELEVPLRAVISTDFHAVRHVGFVSVPEIAYQHDNFGGRRARLKLGIGAAFADQRFQQTLYGVSSLYATAARPAYNASGGYLGSRVQLSFSQRVSPAIRWIGAVRADFHGGAVNEASPLFRRKNTATVGFALIWTIVRSAATAAE